VPREVWKALLVLLAIAGMAVLLRGTTLEHDPIRALSDAAQQVLPEELALLMQQLPVLLPLTGRHLSTHPARQ